MVGLKEERGAHAPHTAHEAHAKHEERDEAAAIGVIANPMSGRDVRRLVARASQQSPDSKRNQVQRAVIGAVAGGAGRVLLQRDCFRISEGAAETLRVDATIEFVDVDIETRPSDTARIASAMRKAGCRAIVVLGGDGTSRIIAKTWPDAPLVPISTGTNNAFPQMLEATTAGAAAGAVATGRISLDEVSQAAKVVQIEFANGQRDLALIDAALLADDHPGNLHNFLPEQIRQLVLTTADPMAIGVSPIGGLLHPSSREDDFGVEVRCTSADGGGRALLVPVSPGLFGNAFVTHARKLTFGEPVEMRGPGVIAFDGDRLRELAPGECVTLRVLRAGPRVIDVRRTLTLAAERGLFFDRHWHDVLLDRIHSSCC
jgi:hypothetical protein